GAGQVWRTDQNEANWSNITERALKDLQGRPEINFENDSIKAFPSYTDWANYTKSDSNPDVFPPRSKIGHYLSERYSTLEIQNLNTISFKLIKEKVTITELVKNKLQIITDNGNCYKVDDILLSIGHQPTQLSAQMKSWKNHASKDKNLNVFENCYPISQFEYLKHKTDVVVGIRGFGLALVDVMRALAKNSFGRFVITNTDTFETSYVKNHDKTITLVPFSLDGKPLAPKPLNNTIDKLFKPSDSDLKSLKTKIESVAHTYIDAANINFLIEPIAEISTKIFTNSKLKSKPHALDKIQLKNLALKWFENEDINHELILNKTSTYALIKAFINMALHKDYISFDYCLGQVWRHCQPTMYKALSHSVLDNELIKKIVDLDDRIKRYSYGPPIESMQQMIALVDSNILNLNFVTDPKIELNDEGWKLINSKNDSIHTSVMINGVLDSAKLLKVDTPLIKNLLSDDVIQPVHSELGIETNVYGCVHNSENTFNASIALLGRLSKGSVIGVDAILECFGKRIEDWAEYYVKNLN
ncbi:MAG: FAD/NAD(P)-binding protein, partial [Algicola sp.]|nr:FAD/NAD(P)-binding protein [Algicola sp.]